jgi:hypothetical protein
MSWPLSQRVLYPSSSWNNGTVGRRITWLTRLVGMPKLPELRPLELFPSCRTKFHHPIVGQGTVNPRYAQAQGWWRGHLVLPQSSRHLVSVPCPMCKIPTAKPLTMRPRQINNAPLTSGSSSGLYPPGIEAIQSENNTWSDKN